jgi:hypothetical protein
MGVAEPSICVSVRRFSRWQIQATVRWRHPRLTATIPLREICRVAAGAGSAVLAPLARRGSAREAAFAELVQRWHPAPPKVPALPVPDGPATPRNLGYHEPHEEYDVQHEGGVVLMAAVPDTDSTAPWSLAGEKLTQPATVRITAAAFDGVHDVHRNADTLTMNDVLILRGNR